MAKDIIEYVHAIEDEYGSVVDCPDDDKNLQAIYKIAKVESVSKNFTNKMPVTTVVDDTLEPLVVDYDCQPVYDYAIKHGVSLVNAATKLCLYRGEMERLSLIGKAPQYSYFMEYNGKTIEGDSAKSVFNEAKKRGYPGGRGRAITEYGYRKVIRLHPLIVKRSDDNAD